MSSKARQLVFDTFKSMGAGTGFTLHLFTMDVERVNSSGMPCSSLCPLHLPKQCMMYTGLLCVSGQHAWSALPGAHMML